MDWINLAAILEKLGVDTDVHTPYRDGQMNIPCPLARWTHEHGTDASPSLTIQYLEPPALFKCFTCGESGTLATLIWELADKKDDDELRRLASEVRSNDRAGLADVIEKAVHGIDDWVKSPDDLQTIALDKSLLSKWKPALSNRTSRNYLYSRSIVHERAIELFDLRYDSTRNRLVCPVYGRSGELVGAVGRSIADEEPRYWNYFNFRSGRALGGHNLSSKNKRLIICEGFFDAVNCFQWADNLGADVVCTWKAELSKWQAEQILQLDKIVSVWYDGDFAGNKGWSKAKDLLGDYTYGLRRAVLPEGKDLGELKRSEFEQIFTSVYGE
jgi:DNA primase